MSKQYSEKIVKFIKSKYLVFDKNKDKYIYGSSKIREFVKNKFNIDINRQTVELWIRKYKWNELRDNIKTTNKVSSCLKDIKKNDISKKRNKKDKENKKDIIVIEDSKIEIIKDDKKDKDSKINQEDKKNTISKYNNKTLESLTEISKGYFFDNVRIKHSLSNVSAPILLKKWIELRSLEDSKNNIKDDIKKDEIRRDIKDCLYAISIMTTAIDKYLPNISHNESVFESKEDDYTVHRKIREIKMGG